MLYPDSPCKYIKITANFALAEVVNVPVNRVQSAVPVKNPLEYNAALSFARAPV